DSGENAFPLPQPSRYTQPFWDACQREELEVSACLDCHQLFLPAGPVCPQCWSSNMSAMTVSGAGEVFTFTVYRHSYHPALKTPYVVALVQLVEGPRLISNIVGCAPEKVKIGMRVQVQFEKEGEFVVPRFIPRERNERENYHA
ncbi:MAG: hypothetical protein HOC23_04440, partial [Halieaceae bacterium]|nr:hypothetical protein [Halieaceae bacterium]